MSATVWGWVNVGEGRLRPAYVDTTLDVWRATPISYSPEGALGFRDCPSGIAETFMVQYVRPGEWKPFTPPAGMRVVS